MEVRTQYKCHQCSTIFSTAPKTARTPTGDPKAFCSQDCRVAFIKAHPGTEATDS